jgi:hypothetical protein
MFNAFYHFSSFCNLYTYRDSALAAVPALRYIEKLSLRNCVYITNKILVRIARSCRSLRCLDISGLDLATETGETYICKYIYIYVYLYMYIFIYDSQQDDNAKCKFFSE